MKDITYLNQLKVTGDGSALEKFYNDNLKSLRKSRLVFAGVPGLKTMKTEKATDRILMKWQSLGLRDSHVAFEVAHQYPELLFRMISLDSVEACQFRPNSSYAVPVMTFKNGRYINETEIIAKEWVEP